MVKIKTADLLTIKFDLDILPPSAREIADAIGLADTLKLVDHFGGTRLRVPTTYKPDYPFCKVIGPASAVKLIEVFCDNLLEVPKCDSAVRLIRNRMIIESDKTARALAVEWGLTERQIRNIRSIENFGFDERQEVLF